MVEESRKLEPNVDFILMVGALLTACAKTGCIEFAFVELFHLEDPALEALRNLDSRHGVDIADGRPDETVLDGLVDVGRRLSNLKSRAIL